MGGNKKGNRKAANPDIAARVREIRNAAARKLEYRDAETQTGPIAIKSQYPENEDMIIPDNDAITPMSSREGQIDYTAFLSSSEEMSDDDDSFASAHSGRPSIPTSPLTRQQHSQQPETPPPCPVMSCKSTASPKSSSMETPQAPRRESSLRATASEFLPSSMRMSPSNQNSPPHPKGFVSDNTAHQLQSPILEQMISPVIPIEHMANYLEAATNAFYEQAPTFIDLSVDDPKWIYVTNLVLSSARWVCAVFNLWCTWYPADLIYPMVEHRVAFCIARHDWMAVRPVSADHLKYWVRMCIADRDEVLKLAAARERGEGRQWVWISDWKGLGKAQKDDGQDNKPEGMDSGRLGLKGKAGNDEDGTPKSDEEGGFWVDAAWNKSYIPGSKKSKGLWDGGKHGVDGVVSLGSNWMCGLYKDCIVPGWDTSKDPPMNP